MYRYTRIVHIITTYMYSILLCYNNHNGSSIITTNTNFNINKFTTCV